MSDKHVKILEEARRLIKLGGSGFVCCAIKDATENIYKIRYSSGSALSYVDRDTETYELLSLIEEAISPYSTVRGWLHKCHGIIAVEGEREYRLAWIDNMIEYWKDKP